MSWSVIRKATADDTKSLNEVAKRFCIRHQIDVCDMDPETAIGFVIEASFEDERKAKRLKPLWFRIVRRVLKEPSAEGIAYGYVGYHVP